VLVTQEAVVDKSAVQFRRGRCVSRLVWSAWRTSGKRTSRRLNCNINIDHFGYPSSGTLCEAATFFRVWGNPSIAIFSLCSTTSAVMSIAPDKLAQLRILQRQYLQLVDPSQLRWPDAQVLKSSEVQSWIFLHMFDESSVKSPPPERYRLRVLKLLISKLERSIVDPEEDVRFPVSSSFLFTVFAAITPFTELTPVTRKMYLDAANTNVTLHLQLLTACSSNV
jgi:hypothetical protein